MVWRKEEEYLGYNIIEYCPCLLNCAHIARSDFE